MAGDLTAERRMLMRTAQRLQRDSFNHRVASANGGTEARRGLLRRIADMESELATLFEQLATADQQ